MKYYTFHVKDSGAIKELEQRKLSGVNTTYCKIYDDPLFNNLNDILHSTKDYILNSKALEVFELSNTLPYTLQNAIVLRKEKFLSFFKRYKSYQYFELTLSDNIYNSFCYDWIDFEKSEVFAIEENTKSKQKIYNHKETLEMIKNNSPNWEKRQEILKSNLKKELKKKELDKYKSYSIEAKKIVFGTGFDACIDLFNIPLYSWGVYVSERFKTKCIQSKINDVGFGESKEDLGIVWKPKFPVIEFEK